MTQTYSGFSPFWLGLLPRPQSLQRWPWCWGVICQNPARVTAWLLLIRLPGPWDFTHTDTVHVVCFGTYLYSSECQVVCPTGLIKVPLTWPSSLGLTGWSIRPLPLLIPEPLTQRSDTMDRWSCERSPSPSPLSFLLSRGWWPRSCFYRIQRWADIPGCSTIAPALSWRIMLYTKLIQMLSLLLRRGGENSVLCFSVGVHLCGLFVCCLFA